MYCRCVSNKVVCAAADGHDHLVCTSSSLFSHGVSMVLSTLSLSSFFLSYFLRYERAFGELPRAPQFCLNLKVPSPT